MKIQRLYIGDFGILRNQTLDSIHPGIVVIGGLNRAGKSTLMQVLKFLGYGFPKGGGLPPAAVKYEVEADVKLGTGDVYNLSLSGHGQPIIKRIFKGQRQGREYSSAQELFVLDDFTYQCLFTITLDELNRSQSLGSEDRRRLQSILLGAGFSDMLLIPQLEQDFYKEADKIGGKRGSPKVKQFKPHYSNIERGRRLKQKGLSQVAEYGQKQQDLVEMKGQVKEISKEIEQLNSHLIRLDIIKTNYDNYLKIKDLESELSYREEHQWDGAPTQYELDKIESLYNEYVSISDGLIDKGIELGIPLETRKLLLDKKDEMTTLIAGISGVQERIRSLYRLRQEYGSKKQDLLTRIKEANGQWNEDHINTIADINTDSIEHGMLIDLVEECRDLISQRKNHVDNLKRLREEHDAFQAQRSVPRRNRSQIGLNRYFWLAMIFTLLGIGLSFLNPLFGAFIGFGGIVGIGIYTTMAFLDNREAGDIIKQQKDQQETRKARMQAEHKIIEELESRISIIRDKLEGYKKTLGLPVEAHYSVLPGHLLRIRDIQDRIRELYRISRDLDDNKGYIEKQFHRYREFICQFTQNAISTLGTDINSLEEDWNSIASILELWNNHLRVSEEVENLEQKLDAIKREIILITQVQEIHSQGFDRQVALFIDRSQKAVEFNKIRDELERISQIILSSMASDGIRRAFMPLLGQESNLWDEFKKLCDSYASIQEVEKEYLDATRTQQSKSEQLDRLREGIQKVEDELEDLAAVENLAQGQKQIDNGRSELKVLAEQYAVNMTAAFLLRETGKSLLEGMKDNIMGSAGSMFSRITGGEYTGILPSEPLLESDFEAILSSDADAQTVDMLSRGTREQLYLSVRLSRITDIKPNLPIIIDDSFANFDSLHLSQSIGILSDISKTHQIFILTCHGDLVDAISKAPCRAQYWKLDKGKLQVCESTELVRHLNLNKVY